jgi:Protein of unknown function (DUF2914)
MNRSLVATLMGLAFATSGCGDHDSASQGESRSGTQLPTTLTVSNTPSPEVAKVVVDTSTSTVEVPRPSPEEPKVEAPRPAQKSDASTLTVKRLVIAKKIEKREPIDPSTTFRKGDVERVYAFVEIANPNADPSEVLITFVPPTAKGPRGNVRLDVGSSPRWRTWAFTRGVDQVGTWVAVVSTPEGRELARQTFEVII